MCVQYSPWVVSCARKGQGFLGERGDGGGVGHWSCGLQSDWEGDTSLHIVFLPPRCVNRELKQQ